MKRICVIDGQGGGIGGAIIRKLKETWGEKIEIIALGTNAVATSQMLKSGANRGASGQNAIIFNVAGADLILGPIGIMIAHAFMGEMAPSMAEAVAASPARKIIIPLSQENIEIAGLSSSPLPHLVDDLVEKHLKRIIEHN